MGRSLVVLTANKYFTVVNYIYLEKAEICPILVHYYVIDIMVPSQQQHGQFTAEPHVMFSLKRYVLLETYL